MDIYVKPYIYPATDSFKEIRVYKFFRKVGARKYELLPGYEGWGFSSKAKAEKRAREEEERIRKEEEAQLEQDELEEDLADLEESIKVGRQLVNDEVGYQYYK